MVKQAQVLHKRTQRLAGKYDGDLRSIFYRLGRRYNLSLPRPYFNSQRFVWGLLDRKDGLHWIYARLVLEGSTPLFFEVGIGGYRRGSKREEDEIWLAMQIAENIGMEVRRKTEQGWKTYPLRSKQRAG